MKSLYSIYLVLLVLLISQCNNKDVSKLDIQGHRGCRGILPENSIPAFVKALELGVNTLELDVVVSKDNQVVVSHEPWISHEICFIPINEDGEPLDTNIYNLDYSDIVEFDCGSKPHPRFPDQERLGVVKPLLKGVFDISELFSKQNDRPPVYYNIEIKRKPEYDSIYHPPMKEFADLVIQVVEQSGFMERITVQCFDIETLQYIHDTYPDIALVYLIESEIDFEKNISSLGFIPEVYSPYFKLVDAALIKFAKSEGMKVIPWTVNDVEDMEAMIEVGVDGLISDYPDRLINFVKSLK